MQTCRLHLYRHLHLYLTDYNLSVCRVPLSKYNSCTAILPQVGIRALLRDLLQIGDRIPSDALCGGSWGGRLPGAILEQGFPRSAEGKGD